MATPSNRNSLGYWTDVERIFSSVVDLGDQANAALDTLCAGRPDLRAEVESLLAAQGRASGFLATTTRDPFAEDAHALSALASAPEIDRDPAARRGQRVGAFTLGELIATGGMGGVYRAERTEGDFTQHVAIKLIAAPMGHPEAARRFRAERQILAALHHPHIVALLDGGITPAGEAYLVMEYVDGEPLSAYCEKRALPLRARLELFRLVCGAVQYLHQNFVVHRDLKPTNILVTRDGVPKVLDFGIAKLIQQPIAGLSPPVTRPEDRALTPGYASPEQLRGLPADTLSDVYALGVLLYEVLTGERPFDLTGKPLDETLRLVLHTEPARPSVAARGRTLPYDPRALRGDLDAIVLRALRKAPDARYASAGTLSADVGRYLTGQPIEAREPSLRYVMTRLAARHKAVFLTAAASVIVILALSVFSLLEARASRAQRDLAEARFQDVRRLANSVIYELHDAIANLPGATEARRLLVSRALEYLDRLAAEARDDDALKRELADAYRRIGQVQNSGLGANVGDTKGALDSYGKALAIRQSLVARPVVDPRDRQGLAELEFDLAALYRVSGQVARAVELYMSAAERFEALRSMDPNGAAPHIRLGAVYQRLAEVQAYAGNTDASFESAQKAASEAEAGWEGRPNDAAARSILAATTYQLSEALADRGRYAEALERTRRARAVLEQALAENPLDAQQTRILLYALNGESRYLRQLGDLGGAVAVGEHALEVAEEASRRDPRDNWSRTAIAVAANALADALDQNGDRRESMRRRRLALDVATKLASEDPQNTYVRLEAASAEFALASALLFGSPSPAETTDACAMLGHVQKFWSDLKTRGQLPQGESSELARIPGLLGKCRPRS
jgi:eukaryotic-like serine/threonine-protein kinase